MTVLYQKNLVLVVSYGYIKILCKHDKCEVLKRERVV